MPGSATPRSRGEPLVNSGGAHASPARLVGADGDGSSDDGAEVPADLDFSSDDDDLLDPTLLHAPAAAAGVVAMGNGAPRNNRRQIGISRRRLNYLAQPRVRRDRKDGEVSTREREQARLVAVEDRSVVMNAGA